MTALIQSGAIADIVLAVMVVEGLLLWALRSRLRNFRAFDIVAILGAGIFLVLALRAALTDAGWHWIALCLTGAFVVHALDLWRQLQHRL